MYLFKSCRHIVYRLLLKMYKPKLGHNSQVGFSMPAIQASQNHCSIEHDEMDELILLES